MTGNRSVMAPDKLAPRDAENVAATAPSAVLVLPFGLTIADVSGCYHQFEIFAQADGVLALDGAAVEIVDGAGMQLLAALLRHAVAQSRTVEWHGVSPALSEAAELMGLRQVLQIPAAGATVQA